MKTIKSYLGALLLPLLMLAACSPEDFDHLSPNGIPTVEGVEPVIVVDQELNQVTFSLPADMKEVMPVWIFNGKEYSTLNGLKKIYAKAGDYEVELKLMNRNGISDGMIKRRFHIDNTVLDFSKYLTLLCGGTSESSKEWRMQNEVTAHLACGPSGTTGTDYWAAAVNEKKAAGIYDNRLVFGSDYSYTFTPGKAGTIFVNTGVKGIWPTYEAAEDYNVPMPETHKTFAFDVVGEDLYITLPAETPFLYIPFATAWTAPRFKVESITGSVMHLVADNGDIAWHYTLTSGAAATKFAGFKYDSPYNLWKPIDDNTAYTTNFYYAPGWTPTTDPGFAQNGSEYTFTLPTATTDQWQAQCFLVPTSLNLSATKKYDFSCTLISSVDNGNVTIKMTDKTSDGNYVFVKNIALKAYEDYVFYLSEVNDLTADADCKLLFDFGGNAANTSVTVKNIVLKDHADDDGTVVPDDDTPAPGTVTWRQTDNLLNNLSYTPFFYYAPGWVEQTAPSLTAANGTYGFALPTATSDQWQAQFHMKNTGISLTAEKKYDVRVKITASKDVRGATIKLAQDNDDNIFIVNERVDLTAYEEYTYEGVALAGADISDLKLVFDFGGNTENTEIQIAGLAIQEHQAGAATLTWDVEAPDNMWTADMVPNHFYYAPGWNPIADPVVTRNGRTYTIALPTATDAQWQAQVATKTNIATSATGTYDFQAVLTANQDLRGVTVKLVLDGDDNTFYFAERIDLKAYEPHTFRMPAMAGMDMDKVNLFLDFGGNPANTEVEVSNIILRKR